MKAVAGRVARRLAVLGSLLSAILGFNACGDVAPGTVVARVDRHTITKATLDRWTAIEAVLSYEANPRQPVPNGVIPDPPSYVGCIAYLQRVAQRPAAGQVRPTTEQLKNRCEQRHAFLQHHVLDILITFYWLSGEGAARGITVSDGEARKLLAQQFPTEAAFRKFLEITGESEADELLILKRDLLSTRLQQSVSEKLGLTSEQQQLTFLKFIEALTKRWSARTSCRRGYVVSECRQYAGPKSFGS